MNTSHSAIPDLAMRFLEPDAFIWGTFAAADGAQLRWGHLPAPNPRADCVLVGGLTEFVEKYFETMVDLSRLGLSVWCLDWRGQGRSTRQEDLPHRPHRRDYDRDAADLRTFTEKMVIGGRPRVLVAHSMGAAISLLALAQPPQLFAGAVLSAPMLGLYTPPVPRFFARLVAAVNVWLGCERAFAPGLGPWKPDSTLSAETSRVSHDPERCRMQQVWYAAQPGLRVDGATYGWVHSALAVTGRAHDPALLKRIAVPVLVGSPGEEYYVDPAATEKALRYLPRGRLISYPGARHELFMERDDFRGPWLSEIGAFLVDALEPRT